MEIATTYISTLRNTILLIAITFFGMTKVSFAQKQEKRFKMDN